MKCYKPNIPKLYSCSLREKHISYLEEHTKIYKNKKFIINKTIEYKVYYSLSPTINLEANAIPYYRRVGTT